MLILDTDHVVEYQKGTSISAHRLHQRLHNSPEQFGTTIITVEEIMRGWIAFVHRVSDPHLQVAGYAKLRQLFRFFATWNVVDWTDASASEFKALRTARAKTGSMDLKIACICLTTNATLLTRNVVDFERIPGLRVEDWLST